MSKKGEPNTSRWQVMEEGNGVTVQIEHACLSDGSKAFNVDYYDGQQRVRFGCPNYPNAKAIARGLCKVAWAEVESPTVNALGPLIEAVKLYLDEAEASGGWPGDEALFSAMQLALDALGVPRG